MLNEKKKVSLKNLVWRGEGYKKIFAEIFQKKKQQKTKQWRAWQEKGGGKIEGACDPQRNYT